MRSKIATDYFFGEGFFLAIEFFFFWWEKSEEIFFSLIKCPLFIADDNSIRFDREDVDILVHFSHVFYTKDLHRVPLQKKTIRSIKKLSLTLYYSKKVISNQWLFFSSILIAKPPNLYGNLKQEDWYYWFFCRQTLNRCWFVLYERISWY